MSGGYRSGGHNCTHGRYEATPRIDSFYLAPMVKRLREEHTSYKIPYEWSRQGKICAAATVFYCGETDSLFVLYELDNEPKQEKLAISYVANPYGGEKMYFICPICGKRVRFLCASHKGFVCRVCGGFNYGVQQSGRDDVLVRRIEKLLHALEVETDLMNIWDMTTFNDVERPQYMRHNKYVKLYLRLLDNQAAYWERQRAKLAGMGVRI